MTDSRRESLSPSAPPLQAPPLATSGYPVIVLAELRPATRCEQLARLIGRLVELPEPALLLIATDCGLPAGCDALLGETTVAYRILRRRKDQTVFESLFATIDRSSLQSSDLLIRVVLDHDQHNRVHNLALDYGHRSILNRDALVRLQQLAQAPQNIALAVSNATPPARLSDADSVSLISGLSRTLEIDKTLFDDAHYYPQGNYALTGHFLGRLFDTWVAPACRAGNNAVLMAIDLGLTAIARSVDLAVVEFRVGHRADLANPALLSSYAEQVLSRPGRPFRAEEFRERSYRATGENHTVQVIAYYLPQFHPIPENDQWWGTGFTEWHNVAKAVPRFLGHYQPHLPADLGFYDLRLPEIMRQQIRLARDYGIHGFCFYHYWFNGKQLLETPSESYHADPTLDLPYCLCWANENWTRRWDGQEREILMGQEHSPRDDLRFIESIGKHLRDPRYIRVEGKPMLLVYRADQFPDAKATAQRWRKYCRDQGIGEIHLVAVLSFAISDPRPLGFDAAVEFPPHGFSQPPINQSVAIIDPEFAGNIYDYRDSVIQAAETKYTDRVRRPFPVSGGCMLSWDNDARRKGKGNIFHHSSPQAYASWLRLAALHGQRTGGPGSRMVFVNAWNEWAEGTHLEPDQRYGHAFLAATAETVRLFAAASDPDLWPEPPAGLGFCSPLLNLTPPPPVHPRTVTDVALYRQRFATLGEMPTLRLVLAFDELDLDVFDTLYTLAEQLYRRFRLTVVTPDEFAAEWAQPHPADLIGNADLVAGINEAIRASQEPWIVFLEKGDRLLPHSLMVLAEHLAAHRETCLAYSDEFLSRESSGGQTHAARLKPDFDRTRLRHTPYLGGLLAVSRQATVELGGLDGDLPGFEQHDLALRFLATHGATPISHLPEILVWRRHLPEERCRLPAEARGDALAELASRYLAAIAPQLTAHPKVSIVVPTRNQPARLQKCVAALFESSTDVDFELLVVDHRNDDPAARNFLDGLQAIAPGRVRVLPFEGDFNIAAINNRAAAAASGDALLFLNDDAAALHPGWLRSMLDELSLPEIGIVGARLLLPDGRLQHIGITLGAKGTADFTMSGQPLETPGRDGELLGPREVGAVTGACLLVRRAVFAALGGFDEDFSIAYADFDFCQRARAGGWRCVVTPEATLLHDAGATLKTLGGSEAAQAGENFRRQQDDFFRRWRTALAHDPAHHRELSLASTLGEIESNPALRPDPIDWPGLPRIYGLPADPHGSGAYRVSQPVDAAHRAGHIRGRIAHGYPLPVVLERLGIEVIHTQRQVDDGQLATLARTRELLPVRVVMDFDDLLTEVPDDNAHKKDIWPDIERRIARACALSDLVTVSTEPLAERLRRYHDHVEVIPNALRRSDWEHARRVRVDAPRRRVGWAGGISHGGDLAVIGEVVRQLADEVDWVFFGMCPEALRPYLAEFHRGVAFEQYPAKLAGLDLDLALAPLASNAFNECKSNLRLLEYGALGIPVIATDLTPYQGELPVTRLANRPAAWIAAIREKLAEPAALRAEGEALQRAVFEHWTEQQTIARWCAVWR